MSELVAPVPGAAFVHGPGWPARAVVYVADESARGVIAAHDGEHLELRLMALAAPGDFQLAFDLARAHAPDGEVEVEGVDAPLPAGELAAALVDWVERERATAVAALQASLAAGHEVDVTGPYGSLTIAPDHDHDLSGAWELLRERQISKRTGPASLAEAITAPLGPALRRRAEAMRAEDTALGPVRPPRRNPVVAVVRGIALTGGLAVALVLRLLAIPVRWGLRGRRARLAARARGEQARILAEQHALLAARPDDVVVRHDRALLLGWFAYADAAELELSACIDRLEAGAPASAGLLGKALRNRAIIRERLRWRGLAARDLERAGPVRHSAWRRIADTARTFARVVID